MDYPSLTNSRAFDRVSVRCYVKDAEADHVTPSELAVDGEIEERQISLPPHHLQARADGPDVFGKKRRLRADELTLVPGLALDDVDADFAGRLHGLSPMVREEDQYRPGAVTDAGSVPAFGAEPTI
jgi:hypothetical protein